MTNQTKQVLAWAALPFAAVANGALRDFTYGKRMRRDGVALAGRRAARRRRADVGRPAGAAVAAAQPPLRPRRRRRLAGPHPGLRVRPRQGARRAADEMLADYDVRRGRLWPLALLVVAASPLLAYRRRREG